MGRDGGSFTRRILTDREEIWCQRSGLPAVNKVAACLAVKESLIKAWGGRPPGFAWKNFELLLPAEDQVPEELAFLWPTLALEMEITEVHYHRCRVPGSDAAWAVWGSGQAMVVAVAVIMD